MSATAFYKQQAVLDFLCEILELTSIEDQRRPLSDSQRVKFAKEIKGVCVCVCLRMPTPDAERSSQSSCELLARLQEFASTGS